jgi:2-dehydro-3-deoxy-D-arabinonate dehydratase
MEESEDAGGGSFYDRVYDADRPEIFPKSNAHRAVGPGQNVRIRADSKWNVPEPELTALINRAGKVVGYTVGNDMSSRDIEGENPLYLPQGKIWDASCALGPCVLVEPEPMPPSTTVEIEITRDGQTVFSDNCKLEQLKRKVPELASYVYRECSFPQGCLLMTGTGIVPPNEFTLHSGDRIRISIEGIGTLENSVA